jgi:alpha-glucosidase
VEKVEFELEKTPFKMSLNSAEKYLRKEQENFFLGSDLLIVPKWSKNGQIPMGSWRNVSINGEQSQNHKYHPDLLIRPGSIIPLCNPIVSTNSFSLDTITLLISLDTNYSAKGKLYSDFGEGYGYKDGEFSLIEFNVETQNGITSLNTKTIDGNSLPNDTKINIKLILDSEVINSSGLIEESIVIKN